jgi:hypothetical protein
MFNKKDIIFYVITGNVIALIAGLAGASSCSIVTTLVIRSARCTLLEASLNRLL